MVNAFYAIAAAIYGVTAIIQIREQKPGWLAATLNCFALTAVCFALAIGALVWVK